MVLEGVDESKPRFCSEVNRVIAYLDPKSTGIPDKKDWIVNMQFRRRPTIWANNRCLRFETA